MSISLRGAGDDQPGPRPRKHVQQDAGIQGTGCDGLTRREQTPQTAPGAATATQPRSCPSTRAGVDMHRKERRTAMATIRAECPDP